MSNKIDCFICGLENLAHNEIGLNKKLIGRNIKKFHCISCLAEYFEVTVEELEEQIQVFKDSGCMLFD